ncbi:hypothetical protein NE237_023511 [Protea cynaroides]|uniref:Uncharacterized protein n=1 Tax=Protea cynaroides TaxID=273540 RepID=A0A9Q0K5G5_9MAGN|nr:hypothetical protein NE237_023511 [Protea cynaroides]
MGLGKIVTREHLHMLVNKLQNPESELYLKALELIMRWLNTALYLNTCGHALIYNYGGTFEKETLRISLSRDGIPRCFPEFHRRMISMRDCKADRLVQLDLSFFSISKLILLVRARYPLKGITQRVEVDELLDGLSELYKEYAVPLFERYIPSYLKKPMEICFR